MVLNGSVWGARIHRAQSVGKEGVIKGRDSFLDLISECLRTVVDLDWNFNLGHLRFLWSSF